MTVTTTQLGVRRGRLIARQLELRSGGGDEYAEVGAEGGQANPALDPAPCARAVHLMHAEHDSRRIARLADAFYRFGQLISREPPQRLHPEPDGQVRGADVYATQARHLRKIFTKLGISSRRELHAALAGLGPDSWAT